jgi:hypothetical protein
LGALRRVVRMLRARSAQDPGAFRRFCA